MRALGSSRAVSESAGGSSAIRVCPRPYRLPAATRVPALMRAKTHVCIYLMRPATPRGGNQAVMPTHHEYHWHAQWMMAACTYTPTGASRLRIRCQCGGHDGLLDSDSVSSLHASAYTHRASRRRLRSRGANFSICRPARRDVRCTDRGYVFISIPPLKSFLLQSARNCAWYARVWVHQNRGARTKEAYRSSNRCE